MEEFRHVDYQKMIPSFIDTIKEQKCEEVLSFLEEHVIKRIGCKDKSVHGMVFYFLTRVKNLDLLIAHLEELEAKKDGKEAVYLDLEYAFNLCKQSISSLKQNFYQQKAGDSRT